MEKNEKSRNLTDWNANLINIYLKKSYSYTFQEECLVLAWVWKRFGENIGKIEDEKTWQKIILQKNPEVYWFISIGRRFPIGIRFQITFFWRKGPLGILGFHNFEKTAARSHLFMLVVDFFAKPIRFPCP